MENLAEENQLSQPWLEHPVATGSHTWAKVNHDWAAQPMIANNTQAAQPMIANNTQAAQPMIHVTSDRILAPQSVIVLNSKWAAQPPDYDTVK